MQTRRQLLASCGVAAGATTLSGCSGLPFGDDDDGDGEPPAYTDWLPDVDAGWLSDADAVTFGSTRVEDVATIEDVPDGVVDDQILGLPVEEYERQTVLSSTTVLTGTFEASAIRDGIEDELGGSLESDGEYSDFQRYGGQIPDLTVGITDGVAVLSPPDAFESVVDASRGDADRLVDVHEDADRLATELGDGHVVVGRAGLGEDATTAFTRDGQVAAGNHFDVGGARTEQTRFVLFASADDADADAVRGEFEDRQDVSDLEATTEGRLVRVTFTAPTDALA